MAVRWLILVAGDALVALTALYAAFVTILGHPEMSAKLSETATIGTICVFILVILFSAHLMEGYEVARNTRKSEVLFNVLAGAFTSFFLLSVIYYLEPQVLLGRGILIVSLGICTLLQFVWHALYLIGNSYPRFSPRVLVLGTGDLALKMGELIDSNKSTFVLAGYSPCESEPPSGAEAAAAVAVPAESIISSGKDLLATAREVGADLIVVALSERRGKFPLRDVLRCKLNNIQIMDAPTIYERVQGKLLLETITPSWIIFSDGFHRSIVFNLLKRGFDILLAVVGLTLSLPIFPLVALAIKLDSPGPVFFRQVRVGNREKHFTLFKFRSMRQDAEVKSGAVWAEKNDPRVTRLGAFLRNTRLDEIPQLINVLKGEMSFVGPRPERPEFVEKLKEIIPYYSKRHTLKPGLTGWAQVRYPYGASVEDALEKLRYDLYYIKNVSTFLDTLIFFETIKVILFGRGVR